MAWEARESSKGTSNDDKDFEMSTAAALDPLAALPVPSHTESINFAVRVLAPLLGVATDSPEGNQLCQYLIDTRGPATAATFLRSVSGRPSADVSQSPRSAARSIMPVSGRRSAEPMLAAQCDAEWLAALAASETPLDPDRTVR